MTSPSSPNREKFETLGRSDFDHPSIKMDDSFSMLTSHFLKSNQFPLALKIYNSCGFVAHLFFCGWGVGGGGEVWVGCGERGVHIY